MAFVPGLELNAGFYAEVVAPLLSSWPHAAARLGWGSDVLGFDTERSTDHGWGPQLLVLVEPDAVDEVRHVVDAGLPERYEGWPVRYGWDATPVSHHVVVDTLSGWLAEQLAVDATAGLSTVDWLLIPQQKLLEVTAGAVFRDDTGELTAVRSELAWYPDDVWRWLLACQWRRLAQEEGFVGRADDVGDRLGAAVVAARQVREVMRMWFLCSRTYWPYTKWFGSAFARLPGTAEIGEVLRGVLDAPDGTVRDQGLARAYELTGRRFNRLGLTEPVDPTTRTYHERPFSVLLANRFTEACRAGLTDELACLPLVGNVDQAADSSDVLENQFITRRLRLLYEL